MAGRAGYSGSTTPGWGYDPRADPRIIETEQRRQRQTTATGASGAGAGAGAPPP